jgi:hypothetical protein
MSELPEAALPFERVADAGVAVVRDVGDPVRVPWGTTHPRVMRSPWSIGQATGFVDALLAAPTLAVLTPTDRHAGALRKSVEELPELAGNILHDTTTAVLMREHGIRRIRTRDTDFHRFPWIEVVDPWGA